MVSLPLGNLNLNLEADRNLSVSLEPAASLTFSGVGSRVKQKRTLTKPELGWPRVAGAPPIEVSGPKGMDMEGSWPPTGFLALGLAGTLQPVSGQRRRTASSVMGRE